MQSDSAYVAQLEKGFPLLSFERSLEHEFRQHYLRSIHVRVVLCLFIGVLFSLWAVFASRGAGPPMAESELVVNLRTWVIRPLSFALLVVALTPFLYRRLWLSVAPFVLAVTGSISAYSAASVVADGNFHAFVIVVSGLLAVLLLLGFLFWQVAVVGSGIAGLYLIFLSKMGVTPAVLGFQAATLAAMVLLALVFSYSLEKSLRTTFLHMRILERLGHFDSMTGLRNRRAFDETLEAVWKQAIRDDKPLGLLLVDVDHFKKYNDRYGHQAGDRCLRQVAGTLAKLESRPLDIAARVGGEEFALLCYGSSGDHVTALAERIVTAVRSLKIPHSASGVAPHITVSVGAVLVQPTLGRSTKSLVQFADQALYEAKHTGRDRVVFNDSGYRAVVTGVFRHDKLVDVN